MLFQDAISCAEDCLKSLCSAVSKHCSDELKFLLTQADDTTNDRVEFAVSSPMHKEQSHIHLYCRIDELGMPHEQLEWYLDTRRHGTVKHSGFSIDLELLILFVTGLKDVRDVIPFPRTKGDAKC